MRAIKYASWPFAESISSLKQAVRIVVISWIGGAKPGIGSCMSSLKVLEYIRRAATTKMSTSAGLQWGDSRQTVMTYSPRDKVALQAGRLGLSHWAGPSVTRSAGESQGSNGGIIVVILAKGREVPLAWEFMYMTEEVI